MTPCITYYPDIGILFNDKIINWEFDRTTIRQILQHKYKEADSKIALSQYHNGSNEFDLVQKRDIYENYPDSLNYFFFNYDKHNLLTEIEIHKGVDICIESVKLNFDLSLQKAVSMLKVISPNYIQVSIGEYFFADLKILIADSESFGGNGNLLTYFYCAKDVSHLLP